MGDFEVLSDFCKQYAKYNRDDVAFLSSDVSGDEFTFRFQVRGSRFVNSKVPASLAIMSRERAADRIVGPVKDVLDEMDSPTLEDDGGAI